MADMDGTAKLDLAKSERERHGRKRDQRQHLEGIHVAQRFDEQFYVQDQPFGSQRHSQSAETPLAWTTLQCAWSRPTKSRIGLAATIGALNWRLCGRLNVCQPRGDQPFIVAGCYARDIRAMKADIGQLAIAELDSSATLR